MQEGRLNDARRERIRELIRTLEAANDRVRVLWEEEDTVFERRSLSSKETEAGQDSKDAADHLWES